MTHSKASVSHVPKPRERWERLVGRMSEGFEENPTALALLESAGWQGGPELLVDELDRLSPEEPEAAAPPADPVEPVVSSLAS